MLESGKHIGCAMREAGFSLVELLVAVAIMSIVGTIAATCLFSVSHVWERCAADGCGRARDLADAFQSDFGRAMRTRGIVADGSACEFWVRADPPFAVRYEIVEGGVTREAVGMVDGRPISSELFRGVSGAGFKFGWRCDAGEVDWRGDSAADELAPDLVSLEADGLPQCIFAWRNM